MTNNIQTETANISGHQLCRIARNILINYEAGSGAGGRHLRGYSMKKEVKLNCRGITDT